MERGDVVEEQINKRARKKERKESLTNTKGGTQTCVSVTNVKIIFLNVF